MAKKKQKKEEIPAGFELKEQKIEKLNSMQLKSKALLHKKILMRDVYDIKIEDDHVLIILRHKLKKIKVSFKSLEG